MPARLKTAKGSSSSSVSRFFFFNRRHHGSLPIHRKRLLTLQSSDWLAKHFPGIARPRPAPAPLSQPSSSSASSSTSSLPSRARAPNPPADRLWVNMHAPRAEVSSAPLVHVKANPCQADCAVHKGKMKEVRTWVETALQGVGPRILVVSGQTGGGGADAILQY